MEIVTLFKFESEGIKISMELYFIENGQLFFDGYDAGKNVEAAWGDLDYEYTHTIDPIGVKKLYKIYGIEEGQKSSLLHTIKDHFNGNKAYSKFGEFMRENKIKFSASSWT